jgi:hypothetical protein
MNRLTSFIDRQPLVEQYFVGVYDIDDIYSAIPYLDLNRKNLFFVQTHTDRLIFCGLSLPDTVVVWDAINRDIAFALGEEFMQMMQSYGNVSVSPFAIQGRSDTRYGIYFALYFALCFSRSESTGVVFGRLSRTDMNYTRPK